MGFDISKITNAALRALAEKYDKDADGTMGYNKLNETEFNAFAADDQTMALVAKDNDAATIFSSIKKEFEGDAFKLTTSPISKVDVTRRDKKEIKKEFERLAEGASSPADLMAKITNFALTPEDKVLLADIDTVYSLMSSQTYRTKADIKENHDKIKKSLKVMQPDKWNNFTQAILKEFEGVKERELNNAKAMELIDKFHDVIEEMHSSDATNAVIQKNGGDNYKAYAEIVKEEATKHKGYRKDGTKDAIKSMEAYAKQHAQDVNDQIAIDNYNGTQSKYTPEVGYGANKVNKHHQEILGYNETSAKRMQELKSVTYSEMEDKLGKDLARKLYRYAEQHKNQNGTYDLTELRTHETFGANKYKGSDDNVKTHEDPTMSERTAIKDGLGLIVNDNRNMFTERETKKLITFLGLHNDPKSHSLKDAVKDEIPCLIAGVAAGLSFWVEMDQTMTIRNLSKQAADEVSKATGAVAKEGANGLFSVKMNQSMATNMLGLAPALAGVALAILLKTILGTVKGERNCFNVEEARAYKTLADLETFTKAKFPNRTEAVMTLAKEFVKRSNGNEELGIKRFLDYLSEQHKGINSPMDPDECWKAFNSKLPPVVVPPVVVNKCTPQGAEIPKRDLTVTHTIKFGDSWTELYKAYYGDCIEEAAKKAGMTPTVYFKKAVAIDKNGNFDPVLYKKLLAGYIPKSVKLPLNIGDCNRIVDYPVDLKFVQPQGAPQGFVGNIGADATAGGGFAITCDDDVLVGKDKQDATTKWNEKHPDNPYKD